nr:PREDICTED: uncharacterized protein LOC105679015 [Linepithema humile]
MSEIILTKDNVFQYFKRDNQKKFRARCNTCGTSLDYATNDNFLRHLRTDTHKEYFIRETNKNIEADPDIYYNKLLQMCDICGKRVSQATIKAHLKTHSIEKMVHHETKRTKNEYMIQYDEFWVKCKLENCNELKPLCLSPTLKKHFEKHKKRNELKNIQTDETRKPTIITNKKELLHNYTLHNPDRFHARCNFCDFEEYYVNFSKIRQHIHEYHNEVYKHEEKHRGYPWKHYKYYNKNKLQCNLCKEWHIEDFTYFDSGVISHIFFMHTLEHGKTVGDVNGTEWAPKYCDIDGDFQVQCCLCPEEMELNIEFTKLNDHIENTHPKEPPSMKRQYETAGPSGSQPQKKKGSS